MNNRFVSRAGLEWSLLGQRWRSVPATMRGFARLIGALTLGWLVWLGYYYYWQSKVDREVPLRYSVELLSVSDVQLNSRPLSEEPGELIVSSKGNRFSLKLNSDEKRFVEADSQGQVYLGFIGRAFQERHAATVIAREAFEGARIDPVFVLHFGPSSGRGWGIDFVTAPAAVKTAADGTEAALHFEFDAPAEESEYQLNLVRWQPKEPKADRTGGLALAGTIVWHHPVRVIVNPAATVPAS